MSEELDDEFGMPMILSGMIGGTNERMKPDPRRPAVEIIGIFHESNRDMGDGRYGRDGLKETKISSSVPYVSVMETCLPWKPTIGDIVVIPELGRTFRVLDAKKEMPTRVRLDLEDTRPIPTS